MAEQKDGVWVFGYGSLMWRPGFPYREVRPALIKGYHRALCIYSIVYRGAPGRPGLVMGLDRGGSCKGLAFLVAAKDAGETLAMLDKRELVHNAYIRKSLMARLDDGRAVTAQAFVARRGHRQYARGLSQKQMAQVIMQGHGPEGSSLDYLKNVIERMDELGVPDGPLHRLLERVEGEVP